MNSIKDFFISYNNADRQTATWVASVLEENGYTVCIQEWDINISDNFIAKMDEFIRTTKNFIPIISRNYFSSKYCESEWTAAYNNNIKNDKYGFIPVVVDNIHIEGLLSPIVHINLYNHDEKAAERILIEGINEALKGKNRTKTEYLHKVKYVYKSNVRFTNTENDSAKILSELKYSNLKLTNWLPLEGYITQNYQKPIILPSDDCELLKLFKTISRKNKHIIIYADGGAGKTTLLKRLFYQIAQNTDISGCLLNITDIYEIIKEDNNFCLSEFINGANYVLLDSFNDGHFNLFSSNETSVQIKQGLWRTRRAIKDINARVIMTGRYPVDKFYNKSAFPDFSDALVIHISGISDNDDIYTASNKIKLSKSALELIKLPLYFNAYEIIANKKDITGKFDILNQYYSFMYEQNNNSSLIDNKIHENVIPLIAMNIKNGDVPFKLSDVDIKIESKDEIINVLKKYDSFLENISEDMFKFRHDDYKHYLTAKAIITQIEQIRANPYTDNLSFNINVDELSIYEIGMISEAIELLGLQSMYNKQWWEVLCLPDTLTICDTLSAKSLSELFVIGLEIGFFRGDPISKGGEIANKDHPEHFDYIGYGHIIDNYYTYIDKLSLGNEPVILWDEWNRDVVEQICRKRIEIFRRTKQFRAGYYMAEKLEPKISGCTYHKARLLLNCYQYCSELLEKKQEKDLIKSEHGYNLQSNEYREELWSRGFLLLNKCAEDKHQSSLTTLGRMYSAPHPAIQSKIKRDNIKGFMYFHQATMCADTHIVITSYAKIQCANMLINEKIYLLQPAQGIVDNNQILNCIMQMRMTTELTAEDDKFAAMQLNYLCAEHIIDEMKYNNSIYIDYLKVRILLYRYNEYNDPKDIIEADNLLNSISESYSAKEEYYYVLYLLCRILANELNGKAIPKRLANKLIKEYRKLKSEADNRDTRQDFERYHKMYVLEDAEQLISSYPELGKYNVSSY